MNVFVYGTLRPGQLLYPAIKAFVADAVDAEVKGDLFMSPFFYPVFKHGEGTVKGQVLSFKEEIPEHEIISHLDAIEGAPYLYTRETVEIDGSPVYIYVGNGAICTKPIPGGDFVAFIQESN